MQDISVQNIGDLKKKIYDLITMVTTSCDLIGQTKNRQNKIGQKTTLFSVVRAILL